MDYEADPTASSISTALGWRDEELLVLSALLVEKNGAWSAACGSLLSLDPVWARTSWQRWADLQPRTRGHRWDRGGFDLGPIFAAEPFHGLRVLRQVFPGSAVGEISAAVSQNEIPTPWGPVTLGVQRWSSSTIIPNSSPTAAGEVVWGTRRPVAGIVGSLSAVQPTVTHSTWELAVPPYLRPGQVLGRISPHRRLLHWPQALLGVDWLGSPKFEPPARFVVGRPRTDAWIADVVPRFEEDGNHLLVSVCWDERLVDPLACTLVYRCENDDGLLLLARSIRISDFPYLSDEDRRPTGDPHREPREASWMERTLTVRIPRGPRRTSWGLQLLSPAGHLLDERPVMRRFESIHTSFGIAGSSAPASTLIVGDRQDPPTAAERDEAVKAAATLEHESRQAAAERRISDAGMLADFLRWRFSCRAGELLLLDPYLLGGKDVTADQANEVVGFLEQLRRPVRAMTGSIGPIGAERLARTRQHEINVRRLPRGRSVLHDRIWIVGETGLLVGGSLNSIARSEKTMRVSTISELPFADVEAWRTRFEEWWTLAPRSLQQQTLR